VQIGVERVARVPRSFFARGAAEVARDLLGTILTHETHEGLVAGRIVEVEAYLAEGDAASHSFRGETARNRSMFGPPGHAYVYFIYGVHHCFNVVTGTRRVGEAVLVRALTPIEGVELMHRRRNGAHDLCGGPGKLTVALGIDRAHDGVDLTRGSLGIWRGKTNADRTLVSVGPRIGITKARELPLRFVSKELATRPSVRAARASPVRVSASSPRSAEYLRGSGPRPTSAFR